MKILLSNPPSETEKATPLPLGLMYVAGYLGSGHDVKIVDMRADWVSLEELKSIVLEFKPDFFGIRCLTYLSPVVYSICDLVKSTLPSCKVVVGGPHAGANPNEIIEKPFIDYVVIGEGEVTFSELVSGKNPAEINGLVYKENNEVKATMPRELIKDLNTIPLPAYHLINVENYVSNPYVHAFFMAGKRVAQIFSSRGCPFHCIYCHKIFGKSIRYRNPENVVKEIKFIHDKYGIDEIQIEDDSFNIDMNRAKKIMDLIAESGMQIKISFPNGIRADFLDEELADKMKKAGVYSVCFGVESGDREIQKFINKRLDLEKVKKAIEITTKRKMLTVGYFMMGFLGETKEQMLRTIEFAKKSKLHMATFFKVTPYPNTELYRLAEERGFLLSNKPEAYTYTFSKGEAPNLSQISTEALMKIIRKAYFQFFSPLRIIRLGWRALNKKMLFVHFFRLVFWRN
ncbi:radical SAM protein [Candidatus Wolfebacteria bacterium]|nr:radical SAM protein [Candidatus Wolfebacteria bacterium]